jgi:hypothetical protein
MAKRRAPAHDVTTEQAIKHLFPAESAEAVTLEAKQARKTGAEAARAMPAHAREGDSSAKLSALRRLREAPDEELALFEDSLRQGALAAGATELELREAQSGHPGHG